MVIAMEKAWNQAYKSRDGKAPGAPCFMIPWCWSMTTAACKQEVDF
jgi:hypothetical protein